VIEDHWITSRFPHNGFCDWQFYDMLQNSNAIVFNDFPKPFKPIIEIVSSFKLIKKQAALFELQVDNGKLLVCTLNLDKKNPAASYLKHTILQYAESDNFQPEIKLGADMFVDFLYNNDSVSREILKTDEAFDEQGRIKKK